MPQRVITDMGGPLVVTDSVTGAETNIGRYGVWEACRSGKSEVVACGDDPAALQAEYGPGLTVESLPHKPA